MLKIVADEKIPLVSELFSPIGKIVLKCGYHIIPNDLIDTDILLVRSITPVNAALLENTSVKFVGSATAGIEHLDIQWLSHAGIHWGYAPGSNAVAIAEYVICCVAALKKQKLLNNAPLRTGVIGAGAAGKQVINKLRSIGFDIIVNDPPRAQQDATFNSTPLNRLTNLDLLTVHVPLIKTPPFATHHLIDLEFLQRQKANCVLINTSRGTVVDNQALLKSPHIIPILDVWENEPHIDLKLLNRCRLASPHIAGYSYQAKLNATLMLYQQILVAFSLFHPKKFAFKNEHSKQLFCNDNTSWEDIVLQVFDPRQVTREMCSTLLKKPQDVASLFKQLRYRYPLRQEFSAYRIKGPCNASTQNILRVLGF